MPRKYTHIKGIEPEVFEMKRSGYTNREIAEHFGPTKNQIVKLITRHNNRQKKIEAGIEIRNRGRQPKGFKGPEHEKDYEIKRLRMENALLRDFLHRILRISANIKPSTFGRYEWIYRNQVRGTPPYHHKLHEIRSPDIQRHYNTMYDESKTSKTIETLNRLLKTFFSYAIDENFLVKNPCNKIVIPGEAGAIEEDNDEIKVIPTQDVAKITSKLESGTMLQMVVLLNLGTGLRQGDGHVKSMTKKSGLPPPQMN